MPLVFFLMIPHTGCKQRLLLIDMFHFIRLLASLLSVVVAVSSTTESPVCAVWSQFARQLNQSRDISGGSLHMICDNKGGNTCERLYCSGSAREQVFFLKDPVQAKFCFGIYLNNCGDAPLIDYFVDVPTYNNYPTEGQIAHSTQIQTPLNYNYNDIGKAEVYLFLNLSKTDSSHLEFSVTAKVHITGLGGLIDQWPPGLQKQLLPPISIPIPACTSGMTPAPYRHPTCRAPEHPTTTTTMPPTTTVTPRSSTYNQSCELGIIGQCSLNESCVEKNSRSKNGRCLCAVGYQFDNETRHCQRSPAVTTVAPKTSTASVSNTTTAKPVNTSTTSPSRTTKPVNTNTTSPSRTTKPVNTNTTSPPRTTKPVNTSTAHPPSTTKASGKHNTTTAKPRTTAPAVKTSTPTQQPVTTAAPFLPLGLCDVHVPTQCKSHQVCTKFNATLSFCLCMQGFVVDMTGDCYSKSAPHTGPSKPHSSGLSKSAVILVCVAAGLVLVVIIGCVVMYIGRRRRAAKFGGIHLPLTNEHDDDDQLIRA